MKKVHPCLKKKDTAGHGPSRQPLPQGASPVIINITPQRRSSRASDLCRPLSVRVRYKMHGSDRRPEAHQKLLRLPPPHQSPHQTGPTPLIGRRFVIPSRSHNFELMMDVPTAQF
ncbi:unnamed protein product [Lasius platythorax]